MGFSPLVCHPNAHHPQAMTMLQWLSAPQCSDAHHNTVAAPMLDQLLTLKLHCRACHIRWLVCEVFLCSQATGNSLVNVCCPHSVHAAEMNEATHLKNRPEGSHCFASMEWSSYQLMLSSHVQQGRSTALLGNVLTQLSYCMFADPHVIWSW